MCRVEALSEQVIALPQNFVAGVQTVGLELKKGAECLVSDASRLLKNAEGCDTTLRATAETVKFIDVIRTSDTVSRPILTRIALVRDLISFTKLSKSIEYLVTGQLYRDVRDKKVLPAITGVAFLFARTLEGIHWLVNQNLILWDTLAQHASKIGGVACSAFVNKIKSMKVVDALYLVALSGLVVSETIALLRGKDPISHFFNIVSLTADVGGIILGFVGFKNPLVMVSLGLTAAATGVVAFLADPSNTSAFYPLK